MNARFSIRPGVLLITLVAMAFPGLAEDSPVKTPGNGQSDSTSRSQDSTRLSQPEKDAIAAIDDLDGQIRDWNRALWQYAEVGLQETRSAALLQSVLKDEEFEIRADVGGMPTAFVASYGSGEPIIGILAEYDALPGLSQDSVGFRQPLKDGHAGHACGHSGLGSGAVGAAIAVRRVMERHGLKGTIRLYGTPAEETVIGKVYMLLAGEFRDLDICLHWHPSSRNEVWAGSSKALISAKFTFEGTAAHASGSPEKGRSALDAVELMNIGANYMREHVKEDARVHYVTIDGGGAPNVVPAKATVWYYVRADGHEDVERYFAWLQDIARGAALMSRTKMSLQIDTDCHELIEVPVLAEVLFRNLNRVSPPKFTTEEETFARRLQQPLVEQFGTSFARAIDPRIHPLSRSRRPSKGSTDVGDISWFVPTAGIRTTCFVAESPGHSWQNVACIGSTIGEKGIVYASRVLALSAVELLQNHDLIDSASASWREQMEGRKYKTLIPTGQKAPRQIR